MSIDLTKPIRLKGSRELRKYGGSLGDGHVVLNSDGTFANTIPVSMESIEAEYENAPAVPVEKFEEKPQPGEYLVVDTPIGKCCDDEPSRYSLSQVMAIPGDDEVYLFATDGRGLSIIAVEGHVNGRRYIPGSVLSEKPGRKNHVNRRLGRWESQYGENSEAEMKDAKFPKLNHLLQSVEGRKSITLDARLLLGIARALGGDSTCTSSVTILIDQEDQTQSKGIACVGRLGIGILMPRSNENHDTSAVDAKRFDVRAERFCSALVDCAVCHAALLAQPSDAKEAEGGK